jgi:hypothetical protein
MRKTCLVITMLLACGALAQEAQPVIIDDVFPDTGPPCHEAAPETQWEYPSCADYHLDTALIDAAKSGDRSALALLEQRYPATLSWEERARIAEAILGKVAKDAEIWKEVSLHAENFVRFTEPDDESRAKRDAWCAARDYDPDEYMGAALGWFIAAASDRRSRPLLVHALASKEAELRRDAVYGFAVQHDESALPLIEETLKRAESPQDAASLLFMYRSDAADRIAMQFIKDEEERARYLEERQQQP